MANQNDFRGVMSKRTFAELHDIVGKLRNDYEPEAVIAANAELKRRKLAGEKPEVSEHKMPAKKLTAEEKANLPLENYWKVIFLFLPGFSRLPFTSFFNNDGYDRQRSEAWKWNLIGMGFYLGVILLAIIIVAIIS